MLAVLISGVATGVATTSASSGDGTVSVTSTANTTLVVDGRADGDDEYATIQAAVDDASDGDTIRVADGTYNETVRIAKPLTLVGDPGGSSPGPGPNAPVLDGGNRTGSAITVVNGTSDVVVSGFEIRNYSRAGGSLNGNGVLGPGRSLRNVTVRETYFHRLGRWAIGFGSLGEGAENLTLVNNRIENVTGVGVRLTNVRTATVSGNRISGGRDIGGSGADAGRAIIVRAFGRTAAGSTSDIRIADNTITGRFDGPFAVVGVNAMARTHDARLTTVTVANNLIDADVPRGRPVAAFSIGSVNRSASGRALIDGVTLRNNTANNTHAGGWITSVNDGRIRNVTIAGTRISRVRVNGLLVSTIGVPDPKPITGRIEAVELRNNTITRARAGVTVRARGTSTIRRLAVSNNDVAHTDRDSLVYNARDGATLTAVTVRRNRITRGETGITVRAEDTATTRAVSVRNNTVDRNRFGTVLNSRHNGTLADVTVVRNTITGSTHGNGISVPAVDQSRLRGLVIGRNTVSDNHKDGIELSGDSAATVRDVTVRGNRVLNNSEAGLVVTSGRSAGNVRVTRNVFVGNDEFGVANSGDGTLNATNNWWGDASGPSSSDPSDPDADPVSGTLADGTGDAVSTGVHFDPWLTANPRAGPGDVTGDGAPARDLDGDGLYEDIDGDGTFDVFDVQSFLDAFGGSTVQENAAKFNFDGEGGVNVFDVQALLERL